MHECLDIGPQHERVADLREADLARDESGGHREFGTEFRIERIARPVRPEHRALRRADMGFH